jgi:hypothetical protein
LLHDAGNLSLRCGGQSDGRHRSFLAARGGLVDERGDDGPTGHRRAADGDLPVKAWSPHDRAPHQAPHPLGAILYAVRVRRLAALAELMNVARLRGFAAATMVQLKLQIVLQERKEQPRRWAPLRRKSPIFG